MKNSILLISFFFIAFLSNAQSFFESPLEPKKAEEMKNTTLIVTLLSENVKYTEKLAKKDAQMSAQYQAMIKNYNEKIQLIFPEMLNVFKSIQFKTLAEIEKMTKAEREVNTFLLLGCYLPSGANAGINFHADKAFKEGIKNYNAEPIFDNKNFYLRWEFYTQNTKSKYSELAYYINIPNTDLATSDLLFTASHLKISFSGKALEYDKKLLTKKVLLICEDDLSEKVSKADIAANYSYAYEIVSKENFEKIISEKSEKYCYLKVVPLFYMPTPFGLATLKFGHSILENGTGKLVLSSGAKNYIAGASSGYSKVDLDHFKEMKKNIDN